MSEAILEQVKQLAARLSRAERARLVEWLGIPVDDRPAEIGTVSSRSLYGICADLGPGPTDADIDEARRELWAAFPREDIA